MPFLFPKSFCDTKVLRLIILSSLHAKLEREGEIDIYIYNMVVVYCPYVFFGVFFVLA